MCIVILPCASKFSRFKNNIMQQMQAMMEKRAVSLEMAEFLTMA